MKTLAAALAAFIVMAAPPPAAAGCKDLKVEDARIPQAPPAATVLAGYARLSNGGDRLLHIDGVEGADFGSIELHQMRMQNGMMEMRPLHGLDVPAHGSVTLSEGDKHLMLIDPKRALRPGDTTTLSFRCGNQALPAQFTVRAAPQ